MTRVARWSARRPRAGLALWLVVTAVLVPFGSRLSHDQAPTSVTIPGSPSARADATARERFGAHAEVPILLQGPPSAVARQADELTQALTTQLHARVSRPQVRAQKGTLLVAAVPSRKTFAGTAGEDVQRISDHVAQDPVTASVTGFSAIGTAIAHESVDAAHRAEVIAVPILLVVLLIVFRSPLAAGIPALLGLATVASAFGLVDLISRMRDVTDVAGPLTSMLGLALGVDYALLMVSRFREGLAEGLDVRDAADGAVARAGRTVIVAGATLLVTMAVAMALSPGDFLLSAAVGVSAAGVMGMFGALVGVPAMLVLVGTRIDRWRIGRASAGGGGWTRFALAVQRHPVRTGLPALVVLLAFVPVATGLPTGAPDVRVLPEQNPTRIATQRVTDTLGPGWAAPYTVVLTPTRLNGSAADPAAKAAAMFGRDERVAHVLGPQAGRGGAAALTVVPRQGPSSAATRALDDRFARLRVDGVMVEVGGMAAALADYKRVLAGRLPWLIVALSLVALIGLTIVLRTVVLAAISVALNLLTIAASLGMVALLCTGSTPLLGGAGTADLLALLGMFAIVFALSLDYQIFILTRMRENWEHTRDLQETITRSIDSTGRVITGAAAIMAGVFLAFTLSGLQTIRQPGIGLVTAVVIDATLVRLVLLPAAMRLAGPATFWLPRWMDRLIPNVDLEGGRSRATATAR